MSHVVLQTFSAFGSAVPISRQEHVDPKALDEAMQAALERGEFVSITRPNGLPVKPRNGGRRRPNWQMLTPGAH